MNVLLGEGIAGQDETSPAISKFRIVPQVKVGELPEPVFKFAEVIAALPVFDAQFFLNFLVEVFEQLASLAW